MITGRVEDAGHQPLVETDIELRKVDEQNRYVQFFNFYPFAYRTDDRGVYRLYGLPAGRYRVSVGRAAGDGGPILGPNAGYFLKTYYPNVTDESRAEIVEVKEGEEATNIDITVASRLKTFRATGRIVDRATSRPLANVSYGYGTVLDNSDRGGGKMLGGSAYVGSRTNSRGEFSLEDLVPGSYAAIVWNDGMIEGFADPAPFEIKDADVSGLEIKVQRGASISGMAIIEGTNDPKLYALLQNQTLIVQVKPQALESRNIRPPRIASDGSFRITGLRAGKAQIGAFSPSAERKIFLSRIEYNGSQQKELELKAGEEITDVQLIFVYGNGVIRGQVNFENGAMPESKQFFVFAALKNKEPQQNVSAIVDARGKFVIEGLQPGEYDLRLTEMFRGQGQAMQPLMKNVSVTNNAETRVVFDLAADGKSTGERDKDNR